MMDGKKHIVAITAFIRNGNGDRFLVVKRSAKEIAYPGKWAFPGGKLEKGESILQTLKREVLEEVGLEIDGRKRFLKDFTFVRPDGHNVVGMCFEVRAASEHVKLAEDFDDFKWIAPAELAGLDHIEGMEEEVRAAFG
ncbi:MAG: NUDIX domain-containing protein [Candidatus Aenigmatarchaeota archaeon]|nr:MAG: NUDIX domain-containing protein [Candidatus Aenigmarchaeota archaeon]